MFHLILRQRVVSCAFFHTNFQCSTGLSNETLLLVFSLFQAFRSWRVVRSKESDYCSPLSERLEQANSCLTDKASKPHVNKFNAIHQTILKTKEKRDILVHFVML